MGVGRRFKITMRTRRKRTVQNPTWETNNGNNNKNKNAKAGVQEGKGGEACKQK